MKKILTKLEENRGNMKNRKNNKYNSGLLIGVSIE